MSYTYKVISQLTTNTNNTETADGFLSMNTVYDYVRDVLKSGCKVHSISLVHVYDGPVTWLNGDAIEVPLNKIDMARIIRECSI